MILDHRTLFEVKRAISEVSIHARELSGFAKEQLCCIICHIRISIHSKKWAIDSSGFCTLKMFRESSYICYKSIKTPSLSLSIRRWPYNLRILQIAVFLAYFFRQFHLDPNLIFFNYLQNIYILFSSWTRPLDKFRVPFQY